MTIYMNVNIIGLIFFIAFSLFVSDNTETFTPVNIIARTLIAPLLAGDNNQHWLFVSAVYTR